MLLLCLLRSKISPVLVPACYRKTRWWQQVQSGILQSCSRLGILQNNLGHWGKYEVKEREGLVFHSQCLLFYVHSGKKKQNKQKLSAARSQLGFSHKSVLISGVIGGTLLRLRLGREQGLNQHIIRHIALQTLQCDRNYHYEELTECLAKPAETKLLGIIKKYKGYLSTDREF